MNKRNVTTVKLRKTYIFLIIILIISIQDSFSQGPNAPEAGGFEPVDATDMVNLLTGDLTYVLPLISVPSPEGGYPLSLSYHAGIGMDQEASWVGLGWNLNPGAINRGVNGFPDDWKSGRITERFYDATQTETETTVRASYSLFATSIATSLSFNSNKGFGGSVGLGVGFEYGNGFLGVGGTVGLSPGGRGYASINGGYTSFSGFSIGGSIGTQGVGINIGTEGAKIGYDTRFVGGSSYSISFGSSAFDKKSSVGAEFSISSSGRASISGTGISQNFSFVQSVSNNDYYVEEKNSSYGISVPTPFGVFGLGFSKNDVKWALNTRNESFVSSALYFDNAIVYRCTLSYQYHGNNSTYSFNVNKPEDCNCNVTIPNTDPNQVSNCTYQISNNVESGNNSIFMDIYEIGDKENSIQNLSGNNSVFPAYDNFNVNAQGLSGKIVPNSFQNIALYGLANKKLSDYDGEYTLYYSFPFVNSWQSDLLSFTRDVNFQFLNENYSSLLVESTDFFNNPNAQNPFDYIVNNGNPSVAPRKKAGKFVEFFTRNQVVNGDINDLILPENLNILNDTPQAPGVYEISTADAIYAFKITTADGKTYHYSMPVYNHETVTRTLDVIDRPENESYFEQLQLTPFATHWLLTAITGSDYIDLNNNNKVDENDYGYWVDFQYGKWSDAFVWKTPYGKEYEEDGLSDTRTVTHGRKQLYYLDKIKTRTHSALFVKSLRDNDNISENWNYEAVSNVTFPDPNTDYYSRFIIPSQKSLKLDKIILLKNENDIVSKNYGQGLDLEGFVNIDYVGHKQETAYYNLENNVIDIKDNINDVINNAIKVIDFGSHYGNSLFNGSPNSTSGRLTLNGVSINGKNNIKLIPSYEFYYNNSLYNQENQDDWGFSLSSPDAGSLNKIVTPTGGELIINYEPDSFYKTAMPNGKAINDGLKFTLIDFPNCFQTGDVKLRISKEALDNNSPISDINLTDLFTTNNPVFLDFYEFAYWRGNGGDRDWGVIDVQAKTGIITSVNNNFIELTIQGTTHCRNGDQDDLNRLWGVSPFSNIKAHGNNWDFRKVERGITSNTPPASQPNNSEYYYTTYTLISNVVKQNENGGGIRVKGISVTDETGTTLTTKYNYNVPGSNQSSGIISYFPYKENSEIQVPYGSELPAPVPLYEYVTVSNILGDDFATNDYVTKSVYKFKVLNEKNANDIKFGDFFELSVNNSFETVNTNLNRTVKAKEVTIEDNLACVGQILEISNYNSEGQLITKTVNEYASKNEITEGIIQESFQTYKTLHRYNGLDDEWLLNSSKRIKYPSILKSTTVTQGSYKTTTYNKLYDTYTGRILETETIDSKGNIFKTQMIPAYTKYSQMGSKVDDIDNKNMLSQNAASYTFIKDGNIWKPIGVGISTWNNNWNYIDNAGNISSPTNPNHKIWRKHKQFIWDGNIDSQGVFIGYDVATHDGFNWSIDTNPSPESDIPQPTQWKEVSETNYYDHYSMPLEVEDINDNKAATKMWDNNSKISVTGNAGYGEVFYSSAENIELEDGIYYIGQGIEATGEHHHDEKSHTGVYSKRVFTSGHAFTTTLRANQHRAGRYKLSVWVDKDNYTNARIVHNGNQAIPFEGEKVVAGNWVQLNHYFDFTSGEEELYLTSINGDIYFDDFRLHPIESSVTSYVYNEYDELTFILGSNNMATKYLYDAAGRLIRVFQETANTPTIEGGFKRAKEYRYNYKRDLSNGGGNNPPVVDVNFTEVTNESGPLASTAKLNGPPGAVVTLEFSIFCLIQNNTAITNSATFEVGNTTYSPLGCDDTNSPVSVQITIPSSGFILCSILKETDNSGNGGGDPSDYGKILITGTDTGTINGTDSFKDYDSITP